MHYKLNVSWKKSSTTTKDKIKMCKCGKHPATSPHTCPFNEEIRPKNKTLCTCCDKCQRECMRDI